jgi:hypothetical protein
MRRCALLVRDLEDSRQLLAGSSFDSGVDVVLVVQEDGELDGRLGSAGGEVGLGVAQCLDERLGSLEALGDNLFGGGGGALFLDEVPGVVGGFGFDHHDGDVITGDAAGNDHVEHGVFQLRVLGESNPLGSVFVGDQGNADAADGAGERQAGELGGHGGGVDGHHVVELVRVDGQDGDHDLDLVAQALDEGRAQRAVHQAAGQDGLGGRAAFTAEERARDAAGSVHTLFDVDRQREEVKAFTRVLAGSGGGQQCGVIVDVHHGCAGCLLGKAAGFEADYALAKTAIVNDCFRELDFGTLQESHLRFCLTEVQPHQPSQHLSTGPAPGHRSRPTGRGFSQRSRSRGSLPRTANA